jgi:hypothetical protein
MAALVVGVPKEIKDKETRVSVQPDGVAELAHQGQDVVVQAGAGSGCGFPDHEYVHHPSRPGPPRPWRAATGHPGASRQRPTDGAGQRNLPVRPRPQDRAVP